MRKVAHIICAAGHGSRMAPLELNIPKPFLRLQGRSLLEHSIDSLNARADDQVLVVLRTSDQAWFERENFARPIETLYLDRATRGQAETAYKAASRISSEAVVVYNADTRFRSKGLRDRLDDETTDGLIPCAHAKGESWSFCKIDRMGMVTQVEEKKRISEWASVGYYYFRQADKFFARAQNLIKTTGDASGELFVAPMYNDYIEAGSRIRMSEVEDFRPMGTPEQISEYWDVSLGALKKENQF